MLNEVREKLIGERRRNHLKDGLHSPRDVIVTAEESSKKVLDSYRQTLDRVESGLKLVEDVGQDIVGPVRMKAALKAG